MRGLGGSMSFGNIRQGLMNSSMSDPLNAGSGPADPGMVGGGFHSGTSQGGPGGGMDPMSMTKWNNRELAGMAADPTGGMSGRRGGFGLSWGGGW